MNVTYKQIWLKNCDSVDYFFLNFVFFSLYTRVRFLCVVRGAIKVNDIVIKGTLGGVWLINMILESVFSEYVGWASSVYCRWGG